MSYFALASLLFAACAPGGDAEAEADAAANALCGGYAGYVRPGQTWHYLGSNAAEDYSDIVLTALSGGKVTTGQTWDRTTDQRVMQYTCTADGVARTAIETTTTTGSVRTTYGAACADVKAAMAPGDEWDCTRTLTRVDERDAGEPDVDEWEESIHTVVSDGGALTVRAGSWDALKVTRIFTVAGFEPATQEVWYAEDVGILKDSEVELVEYSP